MKTKKHFSTLLSKLFLIALLSIFFVACNKSNNPVAPNDSNTTNQPKVTTYTSPTKGWYTKSNINGITSTGKAISPTSGGGGWMTGYANIYIGIFEHPVVTTYLENDQTGDPGNYRVETNYAWKGSISGNGLAGAGANVVITMEIRDLSNNLITTYDIHEKEVKESFLQIGGIIDEGNKDLAVDFNLPNGSTGFKIIFIMRVEAWSGFLGAITQCHFWDRQNLGRGSGWSTLKVTQLNN